MLRKHASLAIRLLSKAKLDKKTGCWVWVGAKINTGRGAVSVNGKIITAHRCAYTVFRGEIGGLCVCHHCDNPLCINPEHLFLGTHLDNMRDMAAKGRKKKTKCKRGHPLKEPNLSFYKGTRFCKKCRKLSARRFLLRRLSNKRNGSEAGPCGSADNSRSRNFRVDLGRSQGYRNSNGGNRT